MRIDAFDLATNVGWASGLAGAKPSSGSFLVRRKGEPPEIAPGVLGERLFARYSDPLKRPDVIAVERKREIGAAMRRDPDSGSVTLTTSADALELQIYLHGALHAVARIFKIDVHDPTAATIRKHLCGKSSAVPFGYVLRQGVLMPIRKGYKKTEREKKEASEATKQMVLDRLMLFGYLPRDATDKDQSDALAVWVWAEGTIGRVIPAELVMV